MENYARNRVGFRRLLAVLMAACAVAVGPGCEGTGGGLAAVSGFEVPPGAVVLSEGDAGGGFRQGGEYHVVLELKRSADVQAFLSQTPWSGADWQRGPVPDEIATNCPALRECAAPLDSPGVWYMAEDSSSGSPPYKSGRLIVVDPNAQRVWFEQWRS